jgi:hypothetical protein
MFGHTLMWVTSVGHAGCMIAGWAAACFVGAALASVCDVPSKAAISSHVHRLAAAKSFGGQLLKRLVSIHDQKE